MFALPRRLTVQDLKEQPYEACEREASTDSRTAYGRKETETSSERHRFHRDRETSERGAQLSSQQWRGRS